MKILFVTNVVPNRAGGGSPRRAANHLETLRAMGHVTVVLPPIEGAPMSDTTGVTVIERGYALADVRLWRHEGSRSRLKRTIHALRRPNLVDGRAFRREANFFRTALKDDFDLVFAFRLRSVLWLESVFGRKRRKPWIADLDDIESTVFGKQIENAVGPWPWLTKLRMEMRWLRRAERRVAAQWNAVCLCSQLDADRFERMTGVKPWVVPNAYGFATVEAEPPSPPCRLLFVGTFGYFANVDGVAWFVETVWPLLRSELAEGVEATLVGLNPTPAIIALGDQEGITVAGNVPSVDPYYEAAHIVIAPLHAGSGTRIKLIEAAAKGRAIVTTTLGCEGLGFVDGIHAEIADDPAEFAARIVRLAHDAPRRQAMAQACRDLAESVFSLETVSRDLRARLLGVIERR